VPRAVRLPEVQLFFRLLRRRDLGLCAAATSSRYYRQAYGCMRTRARDGHLRNTERWLRRAGICHRKPDTCQRSRVSSYFLARKDAGRRLSTRTPRAGRRRAAQPPAPPGSFGESARCKAGASGSGRLFGAMERTEHLLGRAAGAYLHDRGDGDVGLPLRLCFHIIIFYKYGHLGQRRCRRGGSGEGHMRVPGASGVASRNGI